jgi:aminoglycoside phosphotransferase family enzyme/predicted kinase
MTENHHPNLESAMLQPAFYPHPVDRIERIETHISVVYLVGETAYKIKKAVSLGFLDFSTLEKRRHFCEEEVRLNRRLAEGVYQGVVAVTEAEGRLTLEGTGKPVEYAVRMRRMPDRCIMERMLLRGLLSTADIEQLATKLADFYRSAPTGERVGGWETVRENCEENFRQMKPFVGQIISPSRFDLITTATYGFLERRRSLFEERLEKGFVREGHGDLRAEHVYFTPEGIQILDCIEFNERMRFNDVASDAAFLAMDLDYRGAFAVSGEVLCALVCRLDDLRMLALVDFYLCYRACVRLKVTCFRLQQEILEPFRREELLERTRTFAALACRYAERFIRPTIYVVMGMIASGKSTLSAHLAEAYDAELLSSDRIRKSFSGELGEKSTGAPYGKGLYRREARSHVYGKMLLSAQEHIRNHRSVVLDATFDRKKERTEALRLAIDEGAPIVFIECVCPEETIRLRLRGRDGTESLSDARLPLLAEFRMRYEPPEEIPERLLLHADTTRPHLQLVPELFIASRRVCLEGLALTKADDHA